MLIQFEVFLSQDDPKISKKKTISRWVSSGKEGMVQQQIPVLQVVAVQKRLSERSSKLSLCLKGNK